MNARGNIIEITDVTAALELAKKIKSQLNACPHILAASNLVSDGYHSLRKEPEIISVFFRELDLVPYKHVRTKEDYDKAKILMPFAIELLLQYPLRRRIPEWRLEIKALHDEVNASPEWMRKVYNEYNDLLSGIELSLSTLIEDYDRLYPQDIVIRFNNLLEIFSIENKCDDIKWKLCNLSEKLTSLKQEIAYRLPSPQRSQSAITAFFATCITKFLEPSSAKTADAAATPANGTSRPK